MKQVNLYEAKTLLSALVEEAANGEEIVIARNGKARARLVAMPAAESKRGIRWGRWDHLGYKIPDDFNAPDSEIEALWYGDDKPAGEI